MITKNKGEWTELYVFFRLLADGKLYSADENQNKNLSSYLQIVKILREDIQGIKNDYHREVNTIDVYLNYKKAMSIDIQKFEDAANYLFTEIQNGKGPSFSIPVTEKFMNSVELYTVSDSGHKADIFMEVEDNRTGYTNTTGFSIKSDYTSSSKASLINASEATNFVFKLEGTEVNDALMDKVNKINGNRKIIDRMQELKNNNVDLVFYDTYRDKTRTNLKRIDSLMPRIVGEALKISYLDNMIVLKDVLDKLTTLDPLGYNDPIIYKYKFKKLITACSLGLNLGKTWDGSEEATGGIIIVKDNGDCVAYHVYDRNIFEEFNINNMKFERGSTTKHKFATIYKNNNEYFINLNFQLRYI